MYSSLLLRAPSAMIVCRSLEKRKNTCMTEKANHLEQELQRRGKAELITILKLMLQQRPELSWVLQAPQPVTGKHVLSINTHLYQQQIEAAVSIAVEHYRDRAYREALRNTLVTIQTAAMSSRKKRTIWRPFPFTKSLSQKQSNTTSPSRLPNFFSRRFLPIVLMGWIAALLKPEKIRRCVSGLSKGSLQSIASQ